VEAWASWRIARVTQMRIFKAILVLLAWLALPGYWRPDLRAQSPTEYQLKAAFLYNFAKFVEWPPDAFPDADAPIIVAVAGTDSFRNTMARAVENKLVHNRKISVTEWKQNEGIQKCQILFIGASTANPGEILQATRGMPVLTVGESKEFARQGGMINFVLLEKKVRFEVNDKAAASAGLKISSKLLMLAQAVWE
jgi:hypothetical protein